MENYYVSTTTNNLGQSPALSSSLTNYKSRLVTIFCLSVSSGLPFLLLLSTLSIWLLESGVSKTKIGLFAWATAPYALKFLFAPLLDRTKLPILSDLLGKRRGWLLLFQIGVTLSLIGLAKSNPNDSLYLTAIVAFLVGLFSAGQDIVTEAYRIEILDKSQIAAGSTASVIGYRIGMLISGAGVLYFASFFSSWSVAYNLMALFMMVGIITTLLSQEPNSSKGVDSKYSSSESIKNLLTSPMRELFRSHNFFLVLGFIVFFKLVDTVLNVMTMPFLIEIGFSKLEIANVAKTFGILAMIFGGVFAGIYINRTSLYKLLFLCVIFQLIASILFVFQAQIGNNLKLLFLTMGVENFTCGMSQVAIISYLSLLCNKSYTASHYAILSSIASFARVQFSSLGGVLADQVTWESFYIITTISCTPIIFILIKYKKYFQVIGIGKIHKSKNI